MALPTSEQAKQAVNIFASIDVLGLLSDPDYPGAATIEAAIKDYYNNLLRSTQASLLAFAMTQPLQSWDNSKGMYLFNGIWDTVIGMAGGQHKIFASTAGTKSLLNKYVRLIANRGDTQGWKLAVDGSDLTGTPPNQYLTQAFNLSVKAAPGQWIRWWGNSISPFSAIQCVIGNITNENRPSGLAQLENQQDLTVNFQFPSGTIGEGTSSYHTASQAAFSRMGQLKSNLAVGTKIQYDIQFNMVDNQGDLIASFQVDPEIIVI